MDVGPSRPDFRLSDADLTDSGPSRADSCLSRADSCPSRADSGPSRADFGPFRADFDPLPAHSGLIWAHSGLSWAHSGLTWAHSGLTWAHSGLTGAHSGLEYSIIEARFRIRYWTLVSSKFKILIWYRQKFDTEAIDWWKPSLSLLLCIFLLIELWKDIENQRGFILKIWAEIWRIEVFSCTWDDIAWMGREPLTAISWTLDAINTKICVHLGDNRMVVFPKSQHCRPTGTGVMAVQRCASVSCTFTNGAEFPLRSSLILVL